MQNALFQHFVRTKVKQSKMSQAWSHMFLNLRHNSLQTKRRLVWMVHQNGGKFERFWNFQKRLHFVQIKFFSQKFIGQYIESDKKIKNFDDMGP